MAKVISIDISIENGIIKGTIERGLLKVDFGLEEDAYGEKWYRQVSLLGE